MWLQSRETAIETRLPGARLLAPKASLCFGMQIVVEARSVHTEPLGVPSLYSPVVWTISAGLTPSSDSTDSPRFFLRCAFDFPSRRFFEPDLEASSALLIAIARS